MPAHCVSVLFILSPVYKVDGRIFLTLEYTLVDEKCLQKCELCQLNHPENEVTIPIQISSQLDLFTFPYLSLVVYKCLLFYTKPFRLLQNITFSCFFDICYDIIKS